jgi:hypothetical protein
VRSRRAGTTFNYLEGVARERDFDTRDRGGTGAVASVIEIQLMSETAEEAVAASALALVAGAAGVPRVIAVRRAAVPAATEVT